MTATHLEAFVLLLHFAPKTLDQILDFDVSWVGHTDYNEATLSNQWTNKINLGTNYLWTNVEDAKDI